jgi:phage terminase small subunit
MYEHHLNTVRARQRHPDDHKRAATERSLRARHPDQPEPALPPTAASYWHRLVAALATWLAVTRVRLTPRKRGGHV